MTQSAALSTRQSLQIASDIFLASNSIAEINIQKVNFDSSSFYGWPSTFIYNERVRVVFPINSKHVKQFGLIKGLIEFYRPKYFKFVFDATAKSFETDISLDQTDELKDFLSKIFQSLDQEIRFKAVLKKVIAFENRYKADRDQLYSLQHTTLLAV